MVMTLSDRERSRRHADALEDALAAIEATPRAVVPFYPTWRNVDLGLHLVAVHTMAATAVETAATARPKIELPVDASSPPDAIAEAARAARRRLDEVLAGTPLTEVWVLLPGRHPRAWRRRMLCESLLHRFDATQAAGDPLVPDDEEARDAVDEFLGLHLRRGLLTSEHDGTVDLRTDTGWWRVDLATGSTTVTAGRATSERRPPGAIVAGSPLALWGWLNRREGAAVPAVEIDDQAGAIDALASVLDGLGRPA